jgi:hypothetical protein
MIKVLIVCEGNITRLGRVRRTIEVLQEMNAEISSLSGEESNEYSFASQMLFPKLSLTLPMRLYRFGLRVLRRLVPFFKLRLAITRQMSGINSSIVPAAAHWDIIIVEHIDFLPLVSELKKKYHAKILFDVRDFYPREFEQYRMFRLFEAGYRHQVFKHFMKKCDAVASVSNGLVEALNDEYNANAILIRSIPGYEEKHPSPPEVGKIRLVHHGSANADRVLGKMIQLFKDLDDRFTLDFFLVGSEQEIGELKAIAGAHPAIRFNDPVPFSSLINELNKFDAGFYFFIPNTFNIKNALPNKLFEAIQARLMVITSPLESMAEIVNEYECGLVLPSFDFVQAAAIINTLTMEEVVRYKQAAHIAAKTLCFEEEKKKLKQILHNLVKE